MRIGLYGMPTAGKTYIMDRVNFLDVLVGSKLLREYDPDFDIRDEKGREKDRKDVADLCKKRDGFIMDGHYAFGDEIAFTDEEGEMYDTYLYLYINPSILKKRMEQSTKNQKYLRYDLTAWQNKEIDGLRKYCHKHDKDFYVLDCPPDFEYVNADDAIQFLKDIVDGLSNVAFARKISESILRQADSDVISLVDGDKTLICEDSSNFVFGYNTHLFDGNFYTGFQSWEQYREFDEYDIQIPEVVKIHRNIKTPSVFCGNAFIISSGNNEVWNKIAEQLGMKVYAGPEMSAETKYFVTKFLQAAGKKVIAYGDSLSDYFMLKKADEGYLMTKDDGRLSRSLEGKDIGGIQLV
jgi:hypothetical protein